MTTYMFEENLWSTEFLIKKANLEDDDEMWETEDFCQPATHDGLRGSLVTELPKEIPNSQCWTNVIHFDVNYVVE